MLVMLEKDSEENPKGFSSYVAKTAAKREETWGTQQIITKVFRKFCYVIFLSIKCQ